MQPRDDQSPACYLVDQRWLSDDQVQTLAAMLYQMWQPECESVEAAAAYIRDPGLPLRTSWFSTIVTQRIGLMLSMIDEREEEEE
jgi:hypothetical protein